MYCTVMWNISWCQQHIVTRNHTVIDMHHFVKLVWYDKYFRRMCGGLKVVAHALGLQLGCTKICCFLSKWDSRAKESHCYKKFWEDLLTYLLLARHGPRKNNAFNNTELLPSNGRGIHRQLHRRASNSSFIVACIVCLGNMFAEPLPSK
jgi:hypothetical protein